MHYSLTYICFIGTNSVDVLICSIFFLPFMVTRLLDKQLTYLLKGICVQPSFLLMFFYKVMQLTHPTYICVSLFEKNQKKQYKSQALFQGPGEPVALLLDDSRNCAAA